MNPEFFIFLFILGVNLTNSDRHLSGMCYGYRQKLHKKDEVKETESHKEVEKNPLPKRYEVKDEIDKEIEELHKEVSDRKTIMR